MSFSLPLLALLAGCTGPIDYTGAFDLPSAIAVLPVSDDSPFSTPVGYVADQFGGQVSLLDLTDGRFLSDGTGASFVRGAAIAFGRGRSIGAIAAVAQTQEVTLYAIDQVSGTLLKVPHVVGVDDSGQPIRQEVQVDNPVFTGSGEALLSLTHVASGRVSSEEWRLTRRDGLWWLSGSNSGELSTAAAPNEAYLDPFGMFHLLVDEDEGVDGDTFVFHTDNGLEVVPLPGQPVALSVAPDAHLMAIVLRDPKTSVSTLRWIDPTTDLSTLARLIPSVSPARLKWSADSAHLFAADERLPVLYMSTGEAGDETWQTIDLPFVVADYAPLQSGEVSFLYLQPLGKNELWLYNQTLGDFVDINPAESGVSPLRFADPIRGISAIPYAFDWPQVDSNNRSQRGKAVAISLASSKVVFSQERTGCLLQSYQGPRSVAGAKYSSTGDYGTEFKGTVSAPPFLDINGNNGNHVQVNACGGVAPAESWTLTYRSNLHGWEVVGSVSGTQAALAYEDQRYLSDRGEVGFTVRSGASPSEEGWLMSFSVDQGLHTADGNNNSTPSLEVQLTLPGPGIPFIAQPVDRSSAQPYLLVAAQGTDLAGRIHLSTGAVEVSWY